MAKKRFTSGFIHILYLFEHHLYIKLVNKPILIVRPSPKCHEPTLMGIQIMHKCVEENNNRKWYKGNVISVINIIDGDKDTGNEV